MNAVLSLSTIDNSEIKGTMQEYSGVRELKLTGFLDEAVLLACMGGVRGWMNEELLMACIRVL